MKRIREIQLRQEDVLVLNPERKPQSTIRRHYDNWRRDKGIPSRCDNVKCKFHLEPLVWNGLPLKLILDHKDGNRFHNLPSNLQYLCPNCNSQLSMGGGTNRGRVEMVTTDGFILKNKDGSKIAARTGRASVTSTANAVGSWIGSAPDDHR